MAFRASTAVGHRMNAESFKTKTSQLVQDTTKSLYSIWKEAGYEEIECQGLLGDLFLKLRNVCQLELEAEQKILEHAKIQVQNKTAEFSELSTQLGRKVKLPAVLTKADSNYTDKLAELEKILGEIRVEVSQRLSVLHAEYDKVLAVATALGEDIPALDSFNGPTGTPELSDVRLELLRDYHSAAMKREEKRREGLILIAGKCYHVMQELCIPSSSGVAKDDFESSIIESQYQSYYKWLSTSNLARNSSKDWSLGVSVVDERNMNTLLAQVEGERERRRKELAENGAEIARMWTLLRIPTAERDQFTSSFQMNLSAETLLCGRRELLRLREIRTKSLTRVITSIRNDIQTLWTELAIDSVQQQSDEFDMYFQPIETLDDTAVEDHEAYFLALQQRAEEMRPLLQRISRREAIILERIELEHIQLNPERLTARGPNAREDRKREEGMTNRVKTLEKLTKEILTAVEAWESKYGPFLYSGERYSERVQAQEESYIETRDSLRNARKKKDGKLEIMAAISTTKAPPRRAPAVSGATATLAGSLTATKAAPQLTKDALMTASPSSGSGISCVPPPAPSPITASALANLENLGQGSYNYGLPPANSYYPTMEKDRSQPRDSECTAYTSITEVRERESVATVVRGTNNA